MKFTIENPDEGHVIQRYAKGEITISGRTFTRSLIVTPSELIEEWRPQAFTDLSEVDFVALAKLEPELVLLGTGPTIQFPSPALIQVLTEQQIGLDSMDTAAACRTYNILMSEGRKVAAVLFMI